MFLVVGGEEKSQCRGVQGAELILTKNTLCAGGHLHDICYYRDANTSYSCYTIPCILLLFICVILTCITCPRLAAVSLTLLPLLILYRILDQVVHEQLLTLPNVGIQYTTFYKFRRKTTFLDWNDIEDVIINEVIQSQKIIFVLTVLVRTKDNSFKLMPLFMNLKPRLQCIESIYRDVQMLLHGKNS